VSKEDLALGGVYLFETRAVELVFVVLSTADPSAATVLHLHERGLSRVVGDVGRVPCTDMVLERCRRIS